MDSLQQAFDYLVVSYTQPFLTSLGLDLSPFAFTIALTVLLGATFFALLQTLGEVITEEKPKKSDS